MRVKILFSTQKSLSIPINYQYPLMSCILKLLETASREYADFMHNSGYQGLDGKFRKLYTFSRLYFSPKADFNGNALILQPKTVGHFYLCSPMPDEFLSQFILGSARMQQLQIQQASFKITELELVPTPEFNDQTRFRTLSPMVLSTPVEHNGKKTAYYYRPLDDGIAEAVTKSLIGKYLSIHQQYPQDQEIQFQVDRDYISSRGGQQHVSRLVHIKEHDHHEETKIKAFESPFYLQGSRELMQVAWDCGIGDKTNMGFGCIGF